MKTGLYKNPPPYFIVLASSVKTKEVEVIEFHRIEYTLTALISATELITRYQQLQREIGPMLF